ncbi:MAG: hypothetical protein HQK73_09495 [Desulfamplus sp.]|nr:hypothetical protein [Desulfamplus sp.]MBF0412261.1 hypothetical protein [Desulfamplus sp.]
MREKFDLNQMLKEIEEESNIQIVKKKNVKMSQDDIRKLLLKKRKESKSDTQS